MSGCFADYCDISTGSYGTFSGEVKTVINDNPVTTFTVVENGWNFKMRVQLTGEINDELTLTGSKDIKYAGELHKIQVEITAVKKNGVFVGQKTLSCDGIVKTLPFTAVNSDP